MSAIALLDRRGGCATKKYCEATTVGTDGVVVQTRTKYLNNHPVRSLSMLRDFFDVAATPPVQEGQCPVSHFIHTFRPRLQESAGQSLDHSILCGVSFFSEGHGDDRHGICG